MTTIGLFLISISGVGGSERLTISLARSLVNNGYKVKIFTLTGSHENSASRIFGEALPYEVEIVQHSRKRRFKYFGIYQDFLNESFIDRFERECDLLIQTGGDYQPLKVSKRKRIAYCQQLLSPQPGDKYKRGFWRFYIIPYSLILKRRLKHLRSRKHITFVANSEYTKFHLEKRLGLSDVQVIYPPVNIELWRSNREHSRKGLIHVGRYAHEKNHNLLFRIVENINTELQVIGSVTSFTQELYYKQLSRIAPQNVQLFKNLDHDTILNKLHEAKVFLNPSYETFGLAVVEAIAAGCIPVVPNHSGNRETVPFEQLRFDTVDQAREIVKDALDGKYDNFLPLLQEHIKSFDEKLFQMNMLTLIRRILGES